MQMGSLPGSEGASACELLAVVSVCTHSVIGSTVRLLSVLVPLYSTHSVDLSGRTQSSAVQTTVLSGAPSKLSHWHGTAGAREKSTRGATSSGTAAEAATVPSARSAVSMGVGRMASGMR